MNIEYSLLNNNMQEDSLHYLPIEKWVDLQDIFKSDSLRSLMGYHVLENQKRWFQQGINYNFRVYCPYGDMSSGMVAIIQKSDFYEIVIHCPRDDTEKLEDAIKKSKIIDWSKTRSLAAAPDHILDCIIRVSTHVNTFLSDIIPVDQFVLQKTSPTFDDIRLPPEITFRHLSAEHISLVNSKWRHAYPNSSWYFDKLISYKSGYGLFLENLLIAWTFIFDIGSLGHLYVSEEHRKKGYAELITKLICNMLLEDGRDVFGYILKTNVQSRNLFIKLGFKATNNANWVTFNYMEDQ